MQCQDPNSNKPTLEHIWKLLGENELGWDVKFIWLNITMIS